MKNNRALTLGIILSGFISALSGLAGNLASNAVPDPMKPLLHYIWPIFAAVTLAGIGFAIWQVHQQETPVQGEANPLHLSPALAVQNRQRLIAKVRSFWIKGVLENSLHGAALLELGLQEQPDAVAHPWQLVLQETDQSSRPLPPGTRITQVYDEAVGELLILGEPGSGKTTLLLELARDLLDRAEKDSSLPMPMVFNLSSWATRQAPLAEWFVDEMNTKYQVPRPLGRAWIAADQVLPLLDGLDEVKKEYRPACVGAINTFRLQHGLVPMVVCSRSVEYLDLSTRVLLRTAVVVQPLSEQQIEEHLSNAGQPLEAVRVALRADEVLQELAKTPLMLSVLMLAYIGKTVPAVGTSSSPETRRRHVFATYVERMLQHRGSQALYRQEQTKQWLAWLARQLMRENQTEFYLERMQPEWLPKSRQRRVYRIVSSLLVGLFVGWGVGLLAGLLVGLLMGLLMGLDVGLNIGLNAGLGFWLFIGLFVGLFVSQVGGQQEEINPTEAMTWSVDKMPRGLLDTLAVGLFGGLLVGLLVGLLSGLLVGLFGVLLVGLLIVLIDGLSLELLDKQNIVSPNQGIWSSLRNGLLVGLVVGLGVGLLVRLVIGLGVGLLVGLGVGLIVGLLYGGFAFIQHFVLRWFLRYAGVLPWYYVQFLDYTTDHLLLRKVGGGYIFIHRLLMEYFASLPLPQYLVNDQQTQPVALAQDEAASPVDAAES